MDLVSTNDINGNDIAGIDAKEAFKALNGIAAANTVDITPVHPIREIEYFRRSRSANKNA